MCPETDPIFNRRSESNGSSSQFYRMQSASWKLLESIRQDFLGGVDRANTCTPCNSDAIRARMARIVLCHTSRNTQGCQPDLSTTYRLTPLPMANRFQFQQIYVVRFADAGGMFIVLHLHSD